MRIEDLIERGPILIVAAHPDDETIGAGAQLIRWKDRVEILHVTDGSPPGLTDAHAAGCSSREEYAALRRREVLNALAVAGVPPSRCRCLGIEDQCASFELQRIQYRLGDLLDELQPGVILTHPYEGGHPDHDACAFAVNGVASSRSVPVWEFTSYHYGPGGMVTGRFLDGHGTESTVALSAAEQKLKREMFDCFGSQRHMLENFGWEVESFRPAPAYDFTQPPHDGLLHYENYPWGVSGQRWRELAARALRAQERKAYATHDS